VRILLVDDEEELVSTLSERLALRGISSDWATTAEEARKKVRENTFDLAVLDIQMPGIDGITLKRELEVEFPEMRFIFLTGHGSEEDYRAAVAEAGKECYLIKPVGIDTLLRKMREALQLEEKG